MCSPYKIEDWNNRQPDFGGLPSRLGQGLSGVTRKTLLPLKTENLNQYLSLKLQPRDGIVLLQDNYAIASHEQIFICEND